MGNRTSGFRSLARAVAIRCVLAILPLSAQDSPLPNSTVVVGFSSRVMGHANPVDLKAAMKAWLQALARERHLEVEARAEVFDSVNDMASALRQGKLDVVSLPADDFFSLEKQVPLAGMFTNQVRRKAGDQYVVLVRQDQAVKDLASLRGGSIVVLDQTHTLLAPLWLDTELLRKRLPAATRHFARVTHAANPSLALMPVFFKRADATLMTRAGFETACELNPQMASQLTVLLASPELISSIGAYRTTTSASVNLYRKEALRLAETPSGKLILNLFQTDAVVELKESDLRDTRLLVAEYARLLADARRKEGRP